MSRGSPYDVAVVGGGIMGCVVALELARGGMRVVVFERGSLCREASGRNAGGLTMGDKGPILLPYALKGRALRHTGSEWRRIDAGVRVTGGMVLAFTDEEAVRLEQDARFRREAGAAIEVMGGNRAREIEPGISGRVVLATYCPDDGYGNSNRTGLVYRLALAEAGVEVNEGAGVDDVAPAGSGYVLRVGGAEVATERVVLAGGAWLGRMAAWFGVRIPVVCDVKQQMVTERLPRAVTAVLRAANQRLSLKQIANGTVVLGGGWPAAGSLDGDARIIPEAVVGHARIASFAVPALGGARIKRTWIGREGIAADGKPLVGPLPGHDGVFVIGCVRGGWTIGPYMGKLLAQAMLGREPEMPLFDPGRFMSGRSTAVAPNVNLSVYAV